MKYRRLGRTDMEVSILSFGASAIGGVFRPVDQNESIRTVHSAYEGGINYFDVSPAYGSPESEFGEITAEIVLGKALKNIPRDKYFLATKAGKTCHIPLKFDFSYNAIIRSAEESMIRLKVDYLDVLQLHDVEYEDKKHLDQAMNEGINALRELKKQGKIRYFGITSYQVNLCKEIIEAVDLDTILCHNHYSLNDTGLLELIPTVKKRGVGLLNASPLSSGLLSSKGVGSWHPASEDDLKIFRKAAQFCSDNNSSIEKLAIQFSISNPEIPTCLISSSNNKRMTDNIRWAGEEPDLQLYAKVKDILSPVLNKPWIIG